MKNRLPLLPLLGLCLLINGCAGLPVSRPLPAGVSITPVAAIEAGPFSADPAGQQLAYIQQGLRIADLGTKTNRQITQEKPAALAWSPDGKRLAAAFAGMEKSQIRLYAADGSKLGEAELTGTIGDMAWRSPDELLIASVLMSNYKFGSDFQQLLGRWDGKTAPTHIRVHNATLRPGTAQYLGLNFAKAFTISVSPLGDEIAFTRLHDPPKFNAYLRVMLRHLATGNERELANIDLQGSAPAFIGSGDQLLIADGTEKITRLDPWQEGSTTILTNVSKRLAASPNGNYLLADGQLVARSELLTSFPETVQGQFAAQGARLFIQHNNTIYLISGLASDQPMLPAGESLEKLLTLRSWRYQGLITPEDFLKSQPK